MNFIKLFFHTIIWGLKIIMEPRRLLLFNKLNEICFGCDTKTLRILGNGKSLSDNINYMGDIREVDVDYLVLNRHVWSDSYKNIKPKYYVLADPFFFKTKDGVEILNRIKENTTWNMKLLIPFLDKKRIKEINLLFMESKNIKITFYNSLPFNGFEIIKKYLYKYNLSCPRVQNVLVAAIYIGICAKYKLIELYGVEHSWTKHLFVNKNNEVCLENPHFFDIEKAKVQTWKEIQNEEVRIYDVLRKYARMFESYFELKKIADLEGVKIINYTKGSFIDAFDRK